jgi:hypothetical protein
VFSRTWCRLGAQNNRVINVSTEEHGIGESFCDVRDIQLGKLCSNIQSLKQIEDGFGDGALFLHIAAQAHQEQGWFWNRFSSFTAIHAGLFAFNGVATPSKIVMAVGLGLAIGWIVIQALSLQYINRSKGRLHAYERVLGLRAPSGLWKPTSTLVGFIVSVGVGIAWVYTLARF